MNAPGRLKGDFPTGGTARSAQGALTNPPSRSKDERRQVGSAVIYAAGASRSPEACGRITACMADPCLPARGQP